MNHEPLALDLFPEMPAPVPVPKRRAAKNPASSGSVAPIAPIAPVAQPAPGISAQQPVAAAPQSGTASEVPDTMEALAQRVESHSDYRVLRRLQPCLDWPGAEGGATLTVVVLDTETTGLDASKERIIELAMLRVKVDVASGLPVGPVQIYDGLEDPGKPIPKEVVALTGIQDADVQGQALDEERIAEMLDGVDLVIAHNAGFDRPFVENRLAQFAQLRWSCSFADIDWKQQGRGSAKLESLAQAMGWFYDAHRAEMDCHALLSVLAVPLPQGPHTGLAQLVSAATAPSYRLQATGAPFDAKDKLKARGYRWNAEQRVWHTRLTDEEALQAECEWLKENAYNQRSAVVQVEKLDALVRFSNRAGVITQRSL